MRDYRERTLILNVTTEDVRTELYVCPSNCRARVTLLYLVNKTGNITAEVEVFKAATSTYFYIFSGESLSASGRVQFSEKYFVLEPGDKIFVNITGTGIDLDALCTVEETFIPVG